MTVVSESKSVDFRFNSKEQARASGSICAGLTTTSNPAESTEGGNVGNGVGAGVPVGGGFGVGLVVGGTGVAVGVDVGTAVAVGVNVGIGVAVGGTAVAVGVDVGTGVAVGGTAVGIGVGVGTGVAVGGTAVAVGVAGDIIHNALARVWKVGSSIVPASRPNERRIHAVFWPTVNIIEL